jgi:acetyl esterase/lipase
MGQYRRGEAPLPTKEIGAVTTFITPIDETGVRTYSFDMIKEKPPLPPFEELFRLPVVYSVPGMDAAQVREDIVYKSVETSEGKLDLKMDVYRPANARPGIRHPAVIYISGGGVDNPDWRKAGVYKTYGRLAAAQGFVGVTYQKRYARGPESLAAGRDDTAALMSFLRGHAADYGLDPDRFAVWAFSAGGLLLGPLLADPPHHIWAVLNFYALSDALTTMPEETRLAIRNGGFSAAESVKKEGPLPSLFVARAGLDDAGLNAGLDGFVKEALGRNATIEVMNHPGGRHGFDVLNPDTRSREIIEHAFAFLKSHLAVPVTQFQANNR